MGDGKGAFYSLLLVLAAVPFAMLYAAVVVGCVKFIAWCLGVA